MSLAYWLPAIAWMAVISALSFDIGSGEHTGQLLAPLLRWLLPWVSPLQIDAAHFAVRKSAHVTAYAILAALWLRFFRRGCRWSPRASALAAVGIAVAWAILDETHQRFTPSRTAAVGDVAIDAAGALLAVAIGMLGWRPALDGATAIALWWAALAGAAALVAGVIAGVHSPALWLAVPAAVLLLLIHRRRRRRGGPAGPAPPDP
jgi:VanZ family protein